MTDLLGFTLAAFALLMTPGPTNTLLWGSGAGVGFRRSLPLVAMELLGYVVAIMALELVVAPFAHSSAAVRQGLRIVCGLYLAATAWDLWRRAEAAGAPLVSPRRVFLTTLSNPKALVFAFVILPPASIGLPALLAPYGIILFGLTATAGATWVLIGATVRRAARGQGGALIRKTSALIVGSFGAALLVSAAAGGSQALATARSQASGLSTFPAGGSDPTVVSTATAHWSPAARSRAEDAVLSPRPARSSPAFGEPSSVPM